MKDGIKEYIRFNVILAAGLIIIGLLANPWLLASLTGTGSLSLLDKVVVIAFDLFLIASGVLVFFKGNTREDRKKLAFSYITFVLVVLIIETGLHIVSFTVDIDEGGRVLHELAPYKGKEWGKTFWEETYEIEKVFVPFIEWRSQEYTGEYVNINSEGVRKTWNPQPPYAKEFKTIYVFGGSTLWGFGSRDEYTIPSHLSKLLNNNGYDFIVYNYDEPAYMSTQEIVYLVLLLKEGHRPDSILLYDGINDVYSAYQLGVPGIVNIDMLREAWGYIPPSSAVSLVFMAIRNVTVGILSNSMIYQAIGNSAILFSPQQEFQEIASKYDDNQLQLPSEDITGDYLESMELLGRLAQAYDFEYSIFWQPNIFTKKTLTDEEAESDPRVKDKSQAKIYRLTTDFLVAESPPYFFDITDVLSNETDTIYIDSSHISEEGNEVIAERMFQIFEKEFLHSNTKSTSESP